MKNTAHLSGISILKTFSVTIFLILGTISGVGQVILQDSFQSFENYWLGNRTHFIASSNTLRLAAPSESTESWLYSEYQVSLFDTITWEIELGLEFNPSSANFSRIVLMGQPGSWTDFTGVYLSIGESTDAINLMVSDLGKTSILIKGVENLLNTPSQLIHLKIIRAPGGRWSLTSLVNGVASPEGVGISNATYQPVLGFYFKYTATRSTKFYLDNVTILRIKGVDPPPWVTAIDVFGTWIEVTFSEWIDTTKMFQATLEHSPLRHKWIHADQLQLIPEVPFKNGSRHQLLLSGITDLNGNVADLTIPFTYFEPDVPQWGDVIINELMIDPIPSIGLPEVEYLELVNVSDKTFSTRFWTISTSAGVGRLDSVVLYPGDFKVLCDLTDTLAFNRQFRLPVSKMPTLLNGNDKIVLNVNGILLDSVRYNPSQIVGYSETNGGRSIERRDPKSSCLGPRNWRYSLDLTGGTPGKINSISLQTDQMGPSVTNCMLSDSTLEIWYDEPLELVPGFNLIETEPELSLESGVFSPVDKSIIRYRTGMLEQGRYSIKMPSGYDCFGNSSINNSCVVIKSVEPKPGNLMINEVLFNPESGGWDYIELQNSSGFYLDTKGLTFTSYTLTGTTASSKITERVLAPNQYYCFTNDGAWLMNHYVGVNAENVITQTIPAMNDDGAVLVLKSSTGLLDSIRFTSEMHHELLQELSGVSLERISLVHSGLEADNWQSASEGVGYGTPCRKNSSVLSTDGLDGIRIEPEVIISDGRTINSIYIKYNFQSPDYILNITVYNQSGREIKTITRGYLASAEGFIQWDGTTNSGERIIPGAYAIRLEVYRESGLKEIIYKLFGVISSG